MPRNIESVIDQRIKEWLAPEELRKLRKRQRVLPSVALSHSMGSHGEQIAGSLAERLGFQLYDRQLVDLVAEKARVRRSIVEALDEQLQGTIERYITSVLETHYLDPDEHFRVLMKAISGIGAQGGAVIVGRGAGLYLDRDRTVSVRIDAPFETRVERTARTQSLQIEEARARVARSDANRSAYFRKHFHVAWGEPMLYDMTITTEHTSVVAAVAALAACITARFPAVEVEGGGAGDGKRAL